MPVQEVNIGGNYSDEQEAWLKAVAAFRSRHKRYPTHQEAFAIAVALGYRKQETPDV